MEKLLALLQKEGECLHVNKQLFTYMDLKEALIFTAILHKVKELKDYYGIGVNEYFVYGRKEMEEDTTLTVHQQPSILKKLQEAGWIDVKYGVVNNKPNRRLICICDYVEEENEEY